MIALPRRTLTSMKTALLAYAAALLTALAPLPAAAQSGDEIVVAAREALTKKDKARLATLRSAAVQAKHPLAQWVDYFELNNRLNEARADELEAFYARWPGTYVEDRLRNDWLLELGRRRDWTNFARDMPRFKMNDDREVTCYALLTQHMDGQDVRDAARSAWLAQRELGDGCNLLATTLFDAGRLKPDDAWQAARLAAEFGRPRVARAAAALVSPIDAKAVVELFDNPARYLARKPAHDELALLALMRLAAADPAAAATQLQDAWQRRLPPAQAALAWASAGKQAALKQQPEAVEHYRRAWRLLRKDTPPAWSDDMLAWQVRAALRAPSEADRWTLVQRAVDAMSAAEQRDAAWVYWRARSVQALAAPGAAGDADRAAARETMASIAGQMSFYGKLATEELGGSVVLPAPPPPLAAAEREAARATPGLARALQLIELGLRNEGVREWNFTLRGLGDRELLAAAALACEREVWDRCINTSDRTRNEVDMAQRFPTPFRQEVLAKAREIGLDPAYMYGLIRQESRFVMDARSHVGASGLMQIMPATARWTAKKIGLDYKPDMIADRDVNLRLGASYLKLVLDDFGGSQAMAAAAYNAGPNRPRRWREGGHVEPAAWAESIPFNETRDYVKKVLSNAVYYGALLTGQTPSLKTRLGPPIGPREASAPSSDREIP
jgi:soluble lytic murein transglycosylase